MKDDRNFPSFLPLSFSSKSFLNSRLSSTRFLRNVFLIKKTHTVNPRISPRGLICKNECLDGGLFEGGAYSRGGLFQSLAFSSKVDIKYNIIFSVN